MVPNLSRRNLFRGLAGSVVGVAAASVATAAQPANATATIEAIPGGAEAFITVEMTEFESDGIINEIVERLAAELRASGDDELAEIVVTRTFEIEAEI